MPIVLGGILWLPPWFFLVIVAIAVVIAQAELLMMASSAGVPCFKVLPALLLTALLVAVWALGLEGGAAVALVVLIALPAAQLAHPTGPEQGLAGAAITTFSVLYLGVGGACIGGLRLLPSESAAGPLTVFFLVSIWLGDTGAYYVGKTFGRHRMSPRISPNKTWEGLAGGIIATFVTAALVKLVVALPLSWSHTMALAAILAVCAPVGDLVESLFKRDTGVKDSSGLLLGHGGFLDRTDSLVFSGPPVLGYLLLTGALQ
jgi:phosphatidate cytidylyltransferase